MLSHRNDLFLQSEIEHSAEISLRWNISPGWDDFFHINSFLVVHMVWSWDLHQWNSVKRDGCNWHYCWHVEISTSGVVRDQSLITFAIFTPTCTRLCEENFGNVINDPLTRMQYFSYCILSITICGDKKQDSIA